MRRASGLALANQKLQATELLSAHQEERDASLYWVYTNLSSVRVAWPARVGRLPQISPRGGCSTRHQLRPEPTGAAHGRCSQPSCTQGSPSPGLQRNNESFRKTLSVTSFRCCPCTSCAGPGCRLLDLLLRRLLLVGRNGLSGQPYLYTLSLAAPESSWGVLGPLFEQSADSFRLLPPGREFVQPDKDPWRFF